MGVVGVWGRLRGGEASGADLDKVTLDTRLSCRGENQTQDQANRETQTDRSSVRPLITPESQTPH